MLPRLPRIPFLAAAVAALAVCIAPAAASADTDVHITPSMVGGGAIAYGTDTAYCVNALDDRVTKTCPSIDQVVPGSWGWTFIQLIPQVPENGRWEFVRWENCGDATLICQYMGMSLTITAAPKAIFDDKGGPIVTVTPTPSTTQERTVAFGVQADEPAGIECRVDSQAFTGCGSGRTVTLPEGAHTFEARGTDGSGNAGATASVPFTIVDTAITGGPTGATASKAADFVLTSGAGAGTTFECSLDGAAFSACAAAKSYSGLAEGPHTLEVRAKNGAAVDQIPAQRTWTVDTIAPETALDGATGPRDGAVSTNTAETFAFSGAERFECRVDGGAFSPCTSPRAVGGLQPGKHSFEVRAVDAAGNVDATPAGRSWTTLRDADGDGYDATKDCADDDADRHPGARDVADNGADEDCDGADAVNLDRDGDGIPRPADCDDADAKIRPGATDVPANKIDEDCDRADARLVQIPFTLRYAVPSWNRKASKLKLFAVAGLPSGSKLEVTCAGCPKKARKIVKSKAKGTVALEQVVGTRKAGTAIVVKVSKPGMVTTVRTLSFRAGKAPVVTVSCIAPGARKATACA